MKQHFFERVRPLVEQALRENKTDTWPLIVLNLDLKTNEPEHHAAIWALLGEYEAWLTTAVKKGNGSTPQPLDVKPILVLTGSNDGQEQAFSTSLPEGGKLRLFGAIDVAPPARIGSGREAVAKLVDITPEEAMPAKATNYRRWANYPWAIVERGGQVKSADWSKDDDKRLEALVDRAHDQGLWIRFYTLNGHTAAEDQGWSAGYNFGSEAAAKARWDAAIAAGVDFVATDQYEQFTAALKRKR
jgi:glycerophosphoryl diester phosphodiesterase